MRNSKKALTFGSATIDVIASVDEEDIERMTMHNATSSFLLLEEGRKIDVASIKSSVGGGGANTAVSIGKLGFDTTSFVRIGKDLEGQKIFEHLGNENINTDKIIIDDNLPTGKTIMVSSHVCNPTIFTNRGANSDLSADEITADIFTDCDLVYIAGLSGNSAACFLKIAKLAKEAGAFVAANPGIRQLTYWAGDVFEALEYVDLLSINAAEAEKMALTLIPKGTIQNKKHDISTIPQLLKNGLAGRELQQFIDKICATGPKIILITNGSEGAYAGQIEQVEFHPSSKVKVTNTVGAGDAFASTFSAFAANGKTIKTCLRAATYNALSVIKTSDTQTGLLNLKQINNLLDSDDS